MLVGIQQTLVVVTLLFILSRGIDLLLICIHHNSRLAGRNHGMDSAHRMWRNQSADVR